MGGARQWMRPGPLCHGRRKVGHDTAGAAPGYNTGRDASAAGCQRTPGLRAACFAGMALKRRGRVGLYPPWYWSIFRLTGIVVMTLFVMARLVRATYRGRVLV
jgi:hypothetical protein